MTDTILKSEDSRGMQQVIRVTDIVLQWEDTRGMQVDIDIGNEGDGYRFTVWDTRGMEVGVCIGNESDGYRLKVGGYSVDAGRY